jgi:hypothetical protein
VNWGLEVLLICFLLFGGSGTGTDDADGIVAFGVDDDENTMTIGVANDGEASFSDGVQAIVEG